MFDKQPTEGCALLSCQVRPRAASNVVKQTLTLTLFCSELRRHSVDHVTALVLEMSLTYSMDSTSKQDSGRIDMASVQSEESSVAHFRIFNTLLRGAHLCWVFFGAGIMHMSVE